MTGPHLKSLLFRSLPTLVVLVLASGCHSLQKGLVAHYPLDTTGTEVIDASDYGHSGSLSGAETVSGITGLALRFAEDEDVVTIPHAAQLGPRDQLAVSLWIRPLVDPERQRFARLLAKNDSGDGVPYLLSRSWNGGLTFYLATEDRKEIIYRSPPSLTKTGEWSHIVAQWDGSSLSFYVNGKLIEAQSTRNATLISSTAPLSIGRDLDSGYPFQGDIDAIRIYERALSKREVRRLYDEHR